MSLMVSTTNIHHPPFCEIVDDRTAAVSLQIAFRNQHTHLFHSFVQVCLLLSFESNTPNCDEDRVAYDDSARNMNLILICIQNIRRRLQDAFFECADYDNRFGETFHHKKIVCIRRLNQTRTKTTITKHDVRNLIQTTI